MTNILQIGLRSLMTYQSAIQVTAQNLQNARTPFYSRQQITFVESLFSGGVDIGDVNRIYDETANQNLLRCSSALAYINKYLNHMSDFEKVLDNDGTSINRYINDAQTALQELSRNPGSAESRGTYLAKLSSLATQFNTVGNDIANRKQTLNQNIETIVQQENVILSSINDINQQILITPPDQIGGLLDQRNSLVHQLGQYMNISTSRDANNIITITAVNGPVLLSESEFNQLSTTVDPLDPSRLQIMVGINNTQQNVTGNITGGELYGLIQVRNTALDTAELNLSRMALILSSAFNTQNKSGMDNYGNIGENIFIDINDHSIANKRIIASTNNTGSGSISVAIDEPGQLNASNYQLVFSDSTHYSLLRMSDHTLVSQASITSYPATISVDGFTTTLSSGSFNAGDTYTLIPVSGALQAMSISLTDPGKLALAFPVTANASQTNMGNATIGVDAIIDTSNASFETAGQLNPAIKIVFLTDDSYQIINANTNALIEGPITYTAGTVSPVFPTPGAYDPGYRVSLSGSAKAGDTFTIAYNSNGNGDNRNAMAFSALFTQKMVANGQMTFSSAYHMTAADISMKTNLAKSQAESAQIVYDQADARFNEISGVSEIEEMSNLAQYQEAYQACAQVVQVAKTIFDTLLQLSE